MSSVKSILEQATQQGLVLGKSDHAIANVPGRKNAVFTTKPAGAPAVIGDGDYGRQIANWLSYIAGIVATSRNEFLQTSQKSGESCASAKRDHVEAASTIRLGTASLHGKRCLGILSNNVRAESGVEPGDHLINACKGLRRESASCAVFLRIQQFSETGVFLQKGKVFVIPSVIAIFRSQVDSDL
jgi:hypothetical protein